MAEVGHTRTLKWADQKPSDAVGVLAGYLTQGNNAQTKRKGPVSRTLRQVLPCGFPLGLALRLALEGDSLRSFLLQNNLPTISSQRKGFQHDESPLCGNESRLLERSEANFSLSPPHLSMISPLRWTERILTLLDSERPHGFRNPENPCKPRISVRHRPYLHAMVNELVGRVREGFFDIVDGAIEALTLGEYGYEPVAPAGTAPERSCEGRERMGHAPVSVDRTDGALSSF